MSIIDMKAFETVARKDFEFTRETRYLDGKIKVGVAADEYLLTFSNGRLESIGQEKVADADCKIVVRGSETLWQSMLEEKPKPFFQCLQSTAVKHGLEISVTNETFAYLPGLNRMMVLLRQLANKG